MSRGHEEVLERLGPRGLGRVLDDVLDQTRLARLATACRLSYPGIRTRSQKRARILADLVDRAATEEAARRAILRTLTKETSAAARAWARLSREERDGRLQDDGFLLAKGNLGLHLFLLASGDGTDEETLARLVSRADRPAAAGEDVATHRKTLTRLEKANAGLRRKVKHLEGQLAKARETEKALKKDLVQRKGHLAESRMLTERLRRERDEARSAGARGSRNPDSPAAADLDVLAKAVKKLSSEQRKLAHAVAKQPALTAPDLTPLLDSVRQTSETISRWESRWQEASRFHDHRLDEMRDELLALRSALTKSPAQRAASRRRGKPERVGVFIDVQNVYYGARQLKGKLDFDALLQAAVRDRRLIQATAYVVDSKEIDQSGFIARLRSQAITVRQKPLKVRADGSMKGDWDMEIALDILDTAPKLDVVVLVSGDGDFTSLVKRVKTMGPRVEVVGFPRNTAKSLLEAADDFQPLDRKFMIRTPVSRRSAKERERPSRRAPASERSGPKGGPTDRSDSSREASATPTGKPGDAPG